MSLRHRSTGDGSDIPYEKIESVVSKEDGEEEKVGERRGFEKYKFLVSFFVSFLAYSLFSKKVAIASKDYPYALTELSPLSGLLVYGTILPSRYLYETYVSVDRESKRTYDIPWKPAMAVGTLFSLYNLMYNLGNRGKVVPGGLVLLISKLIVVFSGIMSYFPPLRKKLNRNQIIGLIVLLSGAAITLTPRMENRDDNNDSDSDKDDLIVLYVLLLIAAQPVLALAMLIVEYQVTSIHKNLDLIFLWFVVCLFEAFVSLLLAPLNASIAGISMSNIPTNLRDGFICILEGRSQIDSCKDVPFLYIGQVICGCCFNLSMAAAVKNSGGATLMWFVRAMTLPFGAILFCIPWIMEDDAETLSWYEFLGIFLVTFALYVYSIKPHRDVRGDLSSTSSSSSVVGDVP